MSLLTENNRQYYEGAQGFRSDGTTVQFTTTFDTDLKFYASKPDVEEYALNNFKIYTSSNGIPGTWVEYKTLNYRVTGNTINFSATATAEFEGNNVSYIDIPDANLNGPVNIGDYIKITGATWSGNTNYAVINSITDAGLNNVKKYSWDSALYGEATYSDTAAIEILQPIVFTADNYIVVQLKTLDGGNYGVNTDQKAFGNVVEDNYGSYSYTTLNDVINNFLVAYVGAGKLIPSVKRTDVMFHAKRAMQEFSYDTLKSVNSQELTIPHNLSVVLPQDYVNYVNLYWVDNQGVQHPILPTNNLTSNPYTIPLQDSKGVPTQDNFGNDITGTSIVEDRWQNNYLEGNYPDNGLADNPERGWEYYYGWPEFGYGQLFGLEPEYGNINGYFNINEREGKMSFSANLVNKIIVFEYISDGLSTNLETRVPKLAEEAMYAYISHAVIASRINQPEYVVQRLKREASTKLRNAKIRLSNLKLNQIVQVMRGKSKWLKH
tara:strand:+ start:8159 stop:9634 length:1476 start_codon:yes stop_codon:yes gene_type:complete